MKTMVRVLASAAVAAVLFAGGARAAEAGKEVTVTGKIACAMCVLKQKDVKTCTNVLVVSEAGKDVTYALAETPAANEIGMGACEKAMPVKVTGTVTEKDGKKTMAASKIEKA